MLAKEVEHIIREVFETTCQVHGLRRTKRGGLGWYHPQIPPAVSYRRRRAAMGQVHSLPATGMDGRGDGPVAELVRNDRSRYDATPTLPSTRFKPIRNGVLVGTSCFGSCSADPSGSRSQSAAMSSGPSAPTSRSPRAQRWLCLLRTCCDPWRRFSQRKVCRSSISRRRVPLPERSFHDHCSELTTLQPKSPIPLPVSLWRSLGYNSTDDRSSCPPRDWR